MKYFFVLFFKIKNKSFGMSSEAKYEMVNGVKYYSFEKSQDGGGDYVMGHHVSTYVEMKPVYDKNTGKVTFVEMSTPQSVTR